MTPDYPLNALPSGCLLQSEYHIESVLGAGGFGITYLARDGFGRPVALKEYLPNELAVRVGGATHVSARSSQDLGDFQWGLRKFKEEGCKLAAFSHPNINRVLRLFEANGTAYLVLEYVQGRTLSKLLAESDGVLAAPLLTRLLADLLDALQTVHEAGLVHCDLKPTNVMLREGGGKGHGSAVLLDFGASRQAVSQRTKSAVSAFTPPYAALEQYEQDSPDLGPWTDLYGLGMMAYRCITGLTEAELPESVTRAKWYRRGQHQLDLKPAMQVGAGTYPPALLRAVDWALALDEADRPASAQAMAIALELGTQRPDIGASERTPPMPDTTETQTLKAADHGPSSRPRRLIMIGLVILGAAVILYFMAGGGAIYLTGEILWWLYSSLPYGAIKDTVLDVYYQLRPFVPESRGL